MFGLLWHSQIKLSLKFSFTYCFPSIQHHSTLKRSKMAPSIPDRWIPYKACGNIIEGTRFICFKVPLKRNVQTGNRAITVIWDIKTLLSTVPNLGAVIDLTNTARYYDPKELQAAGVLHKKILMPGRIIPPEDKVTEFMDACDEFLGKDCDFLIGVHCTHGLNRTGYMVCRYMRDRMGIDAKEAIKRFQIARGYQIERDNYVAHLIGSEPPPAHFGKSTKLRPIDNTGGTGPPPREDRNNRDSKNKYVYNGQSWRGECRSRNDDDNSGRYVRHPSYSDRAGQSNSRGDGRRTNGREERTSTDSNRSYDYKYDY